MPSFLLISLNFSANLSNTFETPSTPRRKAVHYLKEHGKIDRKTYCEIGGVEKTVAHEELADMVDKEVIDLVGKGRGAYYIYHE